MPVLSALSVTLEIPSLADGVKFYTDAGLEGLCEDNQARFRCAGSQADSIVLIPSATGQKRLHDIGLRADGLDTTRWGPAMPQDFVHHYGADGEASDPS